MTKKKPKKEAPIVTDNDAASLRHEVEAAKDHLRNLFMKRRELGYGTRPRRHLSPLNNAISTASEALRILKHRDDVARFNRQKP